MQITHEEARNMIQLASDEPLRSDQKGTLESHLASCAECREYAAGIQKLEAILQPFIQRQWSQHQLPLSIDALLSRTNNKIPNSLLLATRIAAVTVMFLMLMLSTWQLVLPKANIDASLPASVQPIPIPSTATRFISTKTESKSCEQVSYVVQRNDTLASIAARFSLPNAEIMLRNNMKSESVSIGSKLMIPICNFTPTGTVNTLTTTFTPILRTITATPGG